MLAAASWLLMPSKHLHSFQLLGCCSSGIPGGQLQQASRTYVSGLSPWHTGTLYKHALIDMLRSGVNQHAVLPGHRGTLADGAAEPTIGCLSVVASIQIW